VTAPSTAPEPAPQGLDRAARLRPIAGAAGILVASFAASRVLGLIRNAVLASYFGDTAAYEAYVAAIAVPDAVFQVLAGGVMGAAFIPVFTRYLARGEEAEAWRLASAAITLAALLTASVAAALYVFARPLMGVLVAGRDPAFQELATALVRIMLVSPVLFAVSGFVTSVLNACQRFFFAALAPLMYNMGIIAGVVLLHERYGIYGAALGVAAGAAGHLLIQLPGLLQVRMRYRPTLDWQHAGVREVGQLMVPRMLGLGVTQLHQLATVFLASFLAAGSIAYLSYAWMVLMAPLGMFSMAVATAVFPTLARQSAANQRAEMHELFSLTLHVILFLTVPAAVGLIVLGGPIVRLLFERAAFTPEVTRATALALACYALGLPGHSMVEILARAFYALRDTLTPLKTAALAVLLNLALSGLVVALALGGRVPEAQAYAGLALANACAACSEAALLLWWLRRRVGQLAVPALARAILRYASAALLMGGLLGVLSQQLQEPADTGEQLIVVSALVLVGALTYLACSLVLRGREPLLLLGLFRSG